MLIIHAGDSELVAVDCFECIDAQLDVREKLRHASHLQNIISQNMKKSTLCDLNYANAKKYSYKAYTGTVAYIPYLYDTEVNEDGSVLSGKIGIEYVDAPNIFPVSWKNGEVSECVFAFGRAGPSESSRAKSGDGVI